MIVVGAILLILGLLVAGLHFLLVVGVVLLIVGLILNLTPVGGTGRRYY